MFDKRPIDSV